MDSPATCTVKELRVSKNYSLGALGIRTPVDSMAYGF